MGPAVFGTELTRKWKRSTQPSKRKLRCNAVSATREPRSFYHSHAALVGEQANEATLAAGSSPFARQEQLFPSPLLRRAKVGRRECILQRKSV